VRLAFLVLPILLLGGCSTAPLPTESKIGYNPQTGLVDLKLPKDSKWSLLEFHQTVGTNKISLVIKDGSFTNNPLVISAEAAGYVAMMQTMSSMLNSAISAGVGAAGKVVLPVTQQTVTLPLVTPEATITIKPETK
jgi:hypothetical protein